jgi:hypothetical protein
MHVLNAKGVLKACSLSRARLIAVKSARKSVNPASQANESLYRCPKRMPRAKKIAMKTNGRRRCFISNFELYFS